MDEVHCHVKTALTMPIYTITHQCLLCFARIEESDDKPFLERMISPSKETPPLKYGKRVNFEFLALRNNFLYWVQTTGALKPVLSLDEKLRGHDHISEEVLGCLNVILRNLNRITDKPHSDTMPSQRTTVEYRFVWRDAAWAVESALDHLRQCAIKMTHFSARKPIITGKDGSFRRNIIALIRDRFPAARQVLWTATAMDGDTLSTAHDSFEYPPLPKVTEFEALVGPRWDAVSQRLPGVQCPFCFCELVLRNPENDILSLWRHHIDEHIQPYTCIFHDCKKSEEYFVHREDWVEHMETEHINDWLRTSHAWTWQCDTGHETPLNFEFKSQWTMHMRDSHPESCELANLSNFFAERRRKRRFIWRDNFVCPLCEQIPEGAKRMLEAGQHRNHQVRKFVRNHVADHLKSLSMMAIPSIGDPACEAAKQKQKRTLEAKASLWRPRSEQSRLMSRTAPSVAQNNTMEVGEILTTNGPDIALIGKWGMLSLCYAAQGGFESAVKLLIDNGTRLEATDSRYGQTPLSLAAEMGHIGVVKVLCMNAINGNEDIIRVLIDAGSDMEARSSDRKKTTLHWAVFKHRVESTRLLLQRGAQVDSEDNLYGTALCYAAGEGHLDVVKLLLEYGADTELTSWHEEAPLTLAARRGHVDVVRLLLAYGANIEARNREGKTALDLVQLELTDEGVEWDEVIEVLKSH
ncbi:hypothetical protein FPRO03_06917 [Fusarium proliferatum]|nr:hypothetical protein FPRO03_06917 [Fusarium proliferatum]